MTGTSQSSLLPYQQMIQLLQKRIGMRTDALTSRHT